MRIASVLTSALAAAAIGGLAVASIIDSGYHRLRDLEEAAARDSVAVAKLRGIRESAEHVLTVAGLGLQLGNAALVSDATRQLERLAQAVRELGQFELVADGNEPLPPIDRLIGELLGEIESRRQTDGVPAAALATYEAKAAELGALISRLQDNALAGADAARSVLLAEARHRQRLDPMLLAGYSVLMVLVLLALLRYIAAPVQQLTVKAEDAIELGHSFRPVRRGPRELKQLGGTIASLVGDLEAKVSERTSALAEQAVALRSEVDSRRRVEVELRDAVAAAEAASEAKGKFLSVVSHELRTPMNAILGTLSLLRDSELDGGQRMLVETARESGRALTALLNDVIDLSRIAAGGVELTEIEFDLVETLDQILSLFHPACGNKRVVLAGQLDPEVPRFVRGDQARIRQVLANLVGNAVKFTDRGHILVRIGKSDDDGALVISVEDSGPGIAEEYQACVFADFAQGGPPPDGARGGTGLGLAICKRLVEAMGGRIALSSRPDEGSTFRFTVPLVTGERTESDEERKIRARLRRMDIVIAGSCFAMVESLRSVFDGWVASVQVATDPVALSRIICADGPEKTCIISGPPDRPRWSALLSACRDCCEPGDMIAIVPGTPDAARLAAEQGEFRAIYDRALKPLTLMRLACGEGVIEPAGTVREPVEAGDASILLVEDSAANRMVASAMLEKEGYTVATAANGSDALDLMDRWQPDLVLMDLQMPVMDGYEALAGIRAMPGGAGQTPVIALSANVMAKSDAERRQIDFDAYLQKPLSRTELLDTVAEILERNRRQIGR